MKAKDLMSGDWVRIKRDIDSNDTYWLHDMQLGQALKVTEILSNGINPDWYDGEINDYVPEDAIEPIPLTPEILEKNGFKLISDSKGYEKYLWTTGAIDEYADVSILVRRDQDNNLRWDFPGLKIHGYRYDITMYKFRYVHELQHALKLCEIDKEIEL